MRHPHCEYHEAAAGAARELLRVAAYNIERGRRLDAIVALWQAQRARDNDVVLLSEADLGMARSGNRHVAREFAEALGYSWVFASEFHELTKGDRKERRVSGANEQALHGNAILSRYPLRNVEVVQLPAFFDYRKQYMSRVGNRIAVVADISTPAQTITVASTHLEARSSAAERCAQVLTLTDALATRDRGQPLVIGGDMNTTCLNAHRLGRAIMRRPWLVAGYPAIRTLRRYEPLFAALGERGYHYDAANASGYTFRDRGYRARLDWLFVKNVAPGRIVNAEIYREFDDRHRYSDHLPISVALSLTAPIG
ncbi:MAG: endonuclease/exonuclease/phosphatase family protein [Gammaproteobacteria bacterium]|nr:endonuclease/exonuclease/phosphatase family protein [Gammaproteobacteria bacterium]